MSPCISSSHVEPLLSELVGEDIDGAAVGELAGELLGPCTLLGPCALLGLGVASVLLAPGLLLGVIDVAIALLGVIGITVDGIDDGEMLLDVQALQ